MLVAIILTAYRELAGLGPVSGMNDAYGWGIWKTFNVMVLTALGSGAFAVGIAAWVFRRKRLHALMRMALLTSFLAYACGLLLLGIDAGRPWNFYWIVFPVALEHALTARGSGDLHVDLRHDSAGGREYSSCTGAALVFRFAPAPGSRTH